MTVKNLHRLRESFTKALACAIPFTALAGCGAGVSTETRIEIVKVPVPAPCPVKAEYDKLKGARPVPLRDSPMPGTAEERVAKTGAQLGRYEAEGGWADQVTAALDRCQREGVATPP